MSTNQEFIKKVLNGAKVGEYPIESRMASSTPYSADPMDEVEGLRETFEEVHNMALNGQEKEAETLIKLFIANFANEDEDEDEE